MRWAVILLVFLVACTGVEIPGVPVEDAPEEPEQPEAPAPEPVGCPEDAKICPDGTTVVRVAPECKFEECPEVEPEPLPLQPECTDSDIGLNLNEVGTVRYEGNSYTDTCEDADSVKEYFCSDGKMKSEIKNCGTNRECQDGRCLLSQLSIYSSKCVEGKQQCDGDRIEVCDINGNWKFAGTCPVGCEGGYCLSNACYGPGTKCDRDDRTVLRCNLAKAVWQFKETCKFGCFNGECQ